MDKITNLIKEIEKLERQKKEAKRLMNDADIQSGRKRLEVAKAYKEFYTSKTNEEFVLYESYPSVSALKMYLDRMGQFPLYEYGSLNVKELAEIIKQLYQFMTGKEYDILTIGALERSYDNTWYYGRSHLYFMIGNDATLEPYQEYNGKFIGLQNLGIQMRHQKRQNIINIDANVGSTQDSLDIEIDDKEEYQKYLRNYMYRDVKFSSNKQIFSDSIQTNLSYYHRYKAKGIKDVMDFSIHPNDSYIAKVLISIVIYKRNNHIEELSDDDYNHIFGVLFGEKVNIKEDANNDIARKLIFAPSKRK